MKNLLWTIKQLITNYWLGIVVVGGVVLLVTAAVLRLLTPPPTPVTETEFLQANIDGSATTFSNISYTGSNTTIPPTLLLAKVGGALPTNEVISTLTSRYNLQPNENDTAWYNNLDQLLTQNGVTQQYQLLLSTNENPTSLNKTPEELINIAQTTLQQAFPQLQLTALTDLISYYQSSLELFSPTDYDKGSVVVIPFSYQVDNYPVFFEKSTESPFAVVLTKTGEIQSITFFPEFISIETLEEHKTLSINEAITHINTENKGSVIAAYYDEVVPLDLTTITNGRLTSFSLEYRHDKATALVIPFYHFKGTADNQNGVSMEIDLITPAIETSP